MKDVIIFLLKYLLFQKKNSSFVWKSWIFDQPQPSRHRCLLLIFCKKIVLGITSNAYIYLGNVPSFIQVFLDLTSSVCDKFPSRTLVSCWYKYEYFFLIQHCEIAFWYFSSSSCKEMKHLLILIHFGKRLEDKWWIGLRFGRWDTGRG